MAQTGKRKYHNIHVPLVDTLELSGPEIFKNFEAKSSNDEEKNLLVLTPGMISSLGRLKRDGSVSAEEFLEELDKKKHKINREQSASGEYITYNLLDRLDVVSMQGPRFEQDNYKELENKILKHWEILDLKDSQGGKPQFISNDVEYRISLEHQGLAVDKPNFLLVDANIVKKGIIPASQKFTERLYSAKNNEMPLDEAIELINPEDGTLYPNQFIRILGAQDQFARVTGELEKSNIGKIIGYKNPKVKLLNPKNKKIKIGQKYYADVLGINMLDMEQYLATQYGLFNNDVELCFVTGGQGSGKTLLSYVAAIDQILWYDKEISQARGYGFNDKGEQKRSRFKNVVLLKPNDLIGGKNREIGHLPGNMYEKLKDSLMPYVDAHEDSNLYNHFRFETLLAHPKWDTEISEKRKDSPKINGHAYLPGDCEAFKLTHSGIMRGRSLKSLIVIDEGENFTPYEAKTIIERAAPGSKIIMMGDPFQVDNPRCSRNINGLTYSIKHFLPKTYSSLVHLPRNYRSQMSEDSLSMKVYST